MDEPTERDANPVEDEDAIDRDTTEISYDEQRYPARPRRLRPRDQMRGGGSLRRFATDPRTANGTNPAYIEWLVRQSMLKDADVLGRQLSGQPSMWRNPYARPDARRAIETSDVWFTAYPLSLITRPGESFLHALGDEGLWEAFEQVGITGIHTGPVKRAGGISGWQETPSVDGHFDRISTQIDPDFGDESAFRRLADVADSHGGSVIDDIVPGHTGKGADFRSPRWRTRTTPASTTWSRSHPRTGDCSPRSPRGATRSTSTASRNASSANAGTSSASCSGSSSTPRA